MASSSSEIEYGYDIFLSFRGLDTRKKFTGYLYEALKQEGFKTFRDDDKIERGENIKSELRKAICSSKMSIIVLSKNYANSTACLFETQTIVEQRKQKPDHFILPVFYEVDPGEIKEQAKNLDFGGKKVTVEEAKGWHAALKRFILYVLFMMDPGENNEQAEYFDFGGKKVKVEEVEGWSAALKEVASMAGMVSGNQSNGYEAKFIEEIISVLKSKQTGDYLYLDEHMQNLKRKVEYLEGQERDITSQISSAECRRLWKRPKKEVKIWLSDIQRFKGDVQRLDQEVVGERNGCNVILRVRLGKRINEKVKEATELQKIGKSFDGLLVDDFPTDAPLMPPTKDFVESTKARNVERVWESLMNDDVRKIGVYGMGGIGKTTIMKLIHNRLLKETDKFDSVYWVTASKAFNVIKLQSDIAKEINFTLLEDEDERRRAKHLFAALSLRKKCILIIDDLWEDFLLDIVGIPEPVRSNGCKLVLTTRSFDVCRRMGCTPVKVNLLTEEEAHTLFLTKAVAHDLAPNVKRIAYQISTECACLPLAIVTVAGSLRGLKEIRDWRNALNEFIRSTRDTCDVSKVYEQLKFSYDRLGDNVLQDCFLYCSLYPEDREIEVNQLIWYWIAEGLIGEMNSVEADFDEGHTILRKLRSCCLLESSIKEFREECVRMHDLIRDMALRLTASSPRFMVKAGDRLTSVPYEDWSEDLDRISFMDSTIRELPIRPPVCPRLTTLLLNNTLLSEIGECFFTNMPGLWVLDLSGIHGIKSLPESISNLENLQAIILVGCLHLEYVPSLKKLKALKEFSLTSSNIHELPEGIDELVNLRKLDLSDNRRLGTFPNWMLCRFSKLQYLRIKGARAGVSARDLLCLRQLKVVIAQFYNVLEVTKYVTSQEFQGLERYTLLVGKHPPTLVREGKNVSISSNFGTLRSGVDHPILALYNEVDNLKLPTDLDSFWLDGFHNLIGLSALPCLKVARDLRQCNVSNCKGLESVFSSSIFSEDGQIFLGTVETLWLLKLPRFCILFDSIAPPQGIYFNLKNLSIDNCDNVKNIFPVQLLHNFPNLEAFDLRWCKKLQNIIVEKEEIRDWGHHRDDSNTISLPKLKTLILNCLPSLKSIYDGVMVCPSIEEVHVFGCPLLKRLPLSVRVDSEQATAPPALREITTEERWWESLKWDDPFTKTVLQPYARLAK